MRVRSHDEELRMGLRLGIGFGGWSGIAGGGIGVPLTHSGIYNTISFVRRLLVLFIQEYRLISSEEARISESSRVEVDSMSDGDATVDDADGRPR